MTEELESKLIRKYPELYRYPGWDDIKSSLMCFRFECGDGWYNLLEELSKDIQYEIDVHNRATRFLIFRNLIHSILYTSKNTLRIFWKVIPYSTYSLLDSFSRTFQNTFRIAQIKEKFGGLSFYADGGSPGINALIDMAEEKSYKICEDCGFSSRYGSWAEFEDKNTRRVKVKTWRTSWIRTLCEDCLGEYLKETYNGKISQKDVEPKKTTED